MERSTIHRFGKVTKPLAASERLTISVSRFGKSMRAPCETMVLGMRCLRTVLEEREQSEQGRQHCDAAVAILDVGRRHQRLQQQTLHVDENVALLTLD